MTNAFSSVWLNQSIKKLEPIKPAPPVTKIILRPPHSKAAHFRAQQRVQASGKAALKQAHRSVQSAVQRDEQKNLMQVSVIGAGYVGLVTAACLADVGNVVLCIDIDAGKIERLQRSEIPIHEPGLDQVVARNARGWAAEFSTSYDDAVAHATLIFIAVGTPSGEDGSADLSHVIDCARELGQAASSATR